jgi:hypothetical protein
MRANNGQLPVVVALLAGGRGRVRGGPQGEHAAAPGRRCGLHEGVHHPRGGGRVGHGFQLDGSHAGGVALNSAIAKAVGPAATEPPPWRRATS